MIRANILQKDAISPKNISMIDELKKEGIKCKKKNEYSKDTEKKKKKNSNRTI